MSSRINAELRPAWRNYWFGFLAAGLGFFVSIVAALGFGGENGAWFGAGTWFVLALIVLCFVVFKRFSWKYTIDGTRVSRHYGLISRNQQSVRIRDLRSIELDQSLFQRIFRVGDLAFYSAGSAKAEVRFFGINKPMEWRDRIDDAMDRLKDSNE
jgi:uncharacterized membrane protein YdbT with pleckstrin-like domain